MEIFRSIVWSITVIFTVLFVLLTTVRFIQLMISSFKTRTHNKKAAVIDYKSYLGMENLVPVTVVVPVSNKADCVIECIEMLLELDYTNLEVVVVDDMSTDGSRADVVNHFHLKEIEHAVKRAIPTKPIQQVYFNPSFPSLLYIEKRRGGITDAINCGINASQCPLVICIEPGMHIDKDAILRLSVEFFKDSSTIASCGVIHMDTRPVPSDRWGLAAGYAKMRLPQGLRFSECMKMTAMPITERTAMTPLITNTGPLCLMNKQLILDCGGYRTDSDGTHYEMLLRMQSFMRKNRRDYHMAIQGDVACLMPRRSAKGPFFGRYRNWQYGVIDALRVPWRALFNYTGYGSFGLFYLPYAWLKHVVYVLFEAMAYFTLPLSVASGVISPLTGLSAVLMYLSVTLFITMTEFIIDQRANASYMPFSLSGASFLYALIDTFGYRQAVILVRAFSILNYLSYLGHRRDAAKRAEQSRQEAQRRF